MFVFPWTDLVSRINQASTSITGIRWTGSRFELDLHYSLVAVGGALAAICYYAQKKKPAPYGKHRTIEEERKWGPQIPIILAHLTSDGPSGTIGLWWVFTKGTQNAALTNRVLAGLFIAHYVQRGFIHPLMMKYGQNKVPIGIWLGALGPNVLYHLAIGHWLGNVAYPRDHLTSPMTLVGFALFAAGFLINRYYDWRQAKMKQEAKGGDAYGYPSGGLFELVANPNYLGELIEWLGFAVATRAPMSVMWLLFCAGTFFSRSKANLEWYKKKFRENWPMVRKALIPFIY